METSRPLARGSVRRYARPSALVLRTSETADHAFAALDFILAQSRDSQMAKSRRKTDLAKRFFDRQLRSGESYHQKWLYIWENPIKSGLIKSPKDWSYQGELNVLHWHESA